MTPQEIANAIEKLREGPDPWKHRSIRMCCRTCMFMALKERNFEDIERIKNARNMCGNIDNFTGKAVGRCRRHAPTMNGYPVVFEDDWCGDHKLDETKV